MAGLDVEVEVFGEPVIRRRLLRIADNVTDGREAFRRIVRILRHATERNFDTRGAYGGSYWEDLAPSTLARKRRLNLDLRILRATHRLLDSLLDSTDEEHVEVVGPQELLWGSRVPYGVYHQSRRPRTVIPFRPPVRLPEQDRRSAVRELQRVLMGAR